MTPSNSLALTGFAAFCAAMVNSPVVSFVLIVAILLTCVVVMTCTLLQCRASNKRARKKRGVDNERAARWA